jgi:hypothetical protein
MAKEEHRQGVINIYAYHRCTGRHAPEGVAVDSTLLLQGI